jgi:hypothetical protein
MSTSDRFPVYASRLKDSPYTSGEDEWAQFLEEKVGSLANEIVNGNNTCYLVSGYRGVGKTSFILQVKEKAEKLLDEKKAMQDKVKLADPEKIPELLFVLTNFAKYENQKSLLRRMIRDLYQVYKKNEAAKDANDAVTAKSAGQEEQAGLLYRRIRELYRFFRAKEVVASSSNVDEAEMIFRLKMEDLYKRTFQDIKTQLSSGSSSEMTVSGESDISKFRKYIGPIAQLLASGAGSIYFLKNWNAHVLPTIIFSIGFVIWFILSLFAVKVSFKRTRSEESKNTIEEIYDDEIAAFKFQELMDSFRSMNYQLVFVLDELDKVGTEDLDNLIKEMKPYLLSGQAHFVIVAGQELAYRYLWAYSGDDAVIGSLFSKFYHIPLFSIDNLGEIGRRLINLDNASPDALAKLWPLFDYLIFKCRRVPRSFIARFRQMVVWESDATKGQVPYIFIPESQTIDLQTRTLVMIREIERLIITPKQYEPVLNDYLITQLFINAQQMIFKKDYIQSVDDYLEHYQKSDQLADKAYYQNVEEIIRDLYSRMVQENIVKEQSPQKQVEAKAEETAPKDSLKIEPEKTESGINIVPPASAGSTQNTPEQIKFRNDWLLFIENLSVFFLNEMSRNMTLRQLPDTTYDHLEYFHSIKAIAFSPVQQKSLINLINEVSLIGDGERLRDFSDQLRKHSMNPLAFGRQLTEYVIRQQLKSKLGSDYLEQTLTGFDASFVTNSLTVPDLLIDFRHSETAASDTADADKLIEKLSEYNILRKKGNIVVIIETFFNAELPIDAVALAQDLDSKVENLNPPYYKKINYCSVPKQLQLDIIEKLVTGCISQLIAYQEFSILERVAEKQKLRLSIANFDNEDPQRYLWGQQPQTADRQLTANVTPVRIRSTFTIDLKVTGSELKPLRGFVYFLVHPTFPEQIYKVLARNNAASIQLDGIEAFTAGAVCDEGRTELELNLNELTSIPQSFRYGERPREAADTSSSNPSKSKSVKKNMKK